MSYSVFDNRMREAESLIKDFDSVEEPSHREVIIRRIRSNAQEFLSYGEYLQEFAEEKENEMVDRGEI